jgi:hypothetical protein
MKPDKIYLSLGLLIILTLFSWFTSCTHVANIANIPEVCFTADVLPIFVNNCAIPGCHDGGGRESRMTLNNYADISNTVTAGNANASRSYQAIIAKTGENMMPPSHPISLNDRTIIRVWIEQGAIESSAACPTAINGSLKNSLRGNGVSLITKGSSFSVCQIRQFDMWVKAGYLNN